MRIPGNKNVEIEADRVIKTGDPELLAIEAEKTRRAREIGQVSGLFRVPSVLSFEPEAGRLVFERVHGIVPLEEALASAHDWQPILVRIGRCLATIHDHLRLPDAMLSRWPDRWWFGTDCGAVLHGDFNHVNVQIDQTDGSPVILDWSPTPYLGVTQTVGPREYDIAYFLHVLFFVRRRWRFLIARPRSEGNAFVTGYFEQTGYRPEADQFVRHLDHIGRQMLEIIKAIPMRPWNRARYLINFSRYARYIGSEAFQRLCARYLS